MFGRFFSALGRLLKSGWFLTLIGILILSALIWFFGPLFAFADYRPLDGEITRLVVILVLLFIWGLVNILLLLRARRADKQLTEEIVEAPADPGDLAAEASQEEVDLLKDRLQEAMALLKKSKLGGKRGRRYLYQLPWYIIIGPPGAGKTTALVNSGLQFPLAEKLGKEAISGVGGTRNCDWWFTNEAVLIDTAGRFTTQDSDEAVDRAAWTGFLGLLRKHRRRQPINGALIAISVADLATQSESERLAVARAIKKRIRELHEELGVRFPIYVLFTKTDLVAGFVEYFDDLGREDRGQVWGMTFPLDEGKTGQGAVALFDKELGLLLDQINDRMIERLHQEQDMHRRSLIYGFPQQMASLRGTLRDFLNEVFQPSRYEERALLRGVYFTSGTQDGTPIDRLMGAMARTFGIGRQAISAFSGSGRSYFITRLLREVVFAEAGVVSLNSRLERRRRWFRRGALATGVIVFLGATAIWFFSFQGNKDLIAATQSEIDSYLEQTANLSMTKIDDSDIVSVIQPLNTLRDLPAGYAKRDDDVPMGLTFGLYQGDKVGAQDIVAYRRALNGLLLPRLILRLEEQMQANFDRSDFLYEALKVYLMLGLQGPMDTGLVQQWMSLEWSLSMPGPSRLPVRAALEGHLAALLEHPMNEISLNGRLIDQVRGLLTEFPLAERAYKIIKQSQAARALPPWRISDHAGAASARVFVRPSGESLGEGVEGFYTYKGFHDVFLPAVVDVSENVAGESWVLGPRAEVSLNDEQLSRLSRDVLGLYLDDYAARWDKLLADVVIAPMQSLSHAVEVLNIVSGPNSPLTNLLKGVSEQTTLAQARGSIDIEGAKEGVVGVVAAEAMGKLNVRVVQMLGALSGSVSLTEGGAPRLPGQFIDDRFSNLHTFVGTGSDAPSGLDAMVTTVTELYRELNRLASSPNQNAAALSAGAGGGGGAAKKLISAATRMPQPARDWAIALAQSSSTITVSGARSQLNASWQAGILPLCQKALNNRYPIFKGGAADVTLNDFSRLFAPGGMIDGYFNTNLRPFVDTSTKPWRWQRVDNVDLGISLSVLAEFEKAAEIRDSLFAGGGSMPAVSFEIVPVDLDASSTQVLLEIEGQTVTYNHGPPRPVRLRWPGSSGPQQVRVTFSPPVAGTPMTIKKDGPWAWFRLLDEAQVTRSSLSDRFNVTFQVGGRSATFELRANSVNNPFSLTSLERFRCPGSL